MAKEKFILEQNIKLKLENKILKKRLSLLSLIMNMKLDTDKRAAIFKSLQDIENLEIGNYIPLEIASDQGYLDTVPTVFTMRELSK